MLDAEPFELLLRQNRSNWCCRFHVIASDGWLGLEQEEDLIMRNLVPGCLAKFEGSVVLVLSAKRNGTSYRITLKKNRSNRFMIHTKFLIQYQ